MKLETEMARFSATELKGMQGLSKGIGQGVGGITKSMKALGQDDEELMGILAVSSSAMQTIAGSLGAMRGLQALWNMRNDLKAAEGGALTAVKAAMGPIGWGQIALASACALGASTAMYALVNDIEVGDFDLSTSAGMSGMLGSLGRIL